jgi:hypothetical protein
MQPPTGEALTGEEAITRQKRELKEYLPSSKKHFGVAPIALRRVNTSNTRHRKNNSREAKMHIFILVYEVVGSGGGLVEETVTAASEFNARNLIYAKFRGQTVRIHSARRIS